MAAWNASMTSTQGASLTRRRQRGSRIAIQLEEDEQAVAGIEVDRLSFMNTALRALPGNALRTFFAPIVNVKRVLFQRRRLTERSADAKRRDRLFKDAVTALIRCLTDAALDLFDSPIPLDERQLAEALRGKLVFACYEPGAVLAYPGELPETMFTHVVLSGVVRVTSFQPQNRKGATGDSSKRQYFVTNDAIRLGGSLGLQPELLKFITNPVDSSNDANSEVGSTSNVSTAIQRSLRRASRMIGQPTLQTLRTEVMRAPYVVCGAEALGMEPYRLATITAESATADGGTTETMCIRTRDLHNVLIQMTLANSVRPRPSPPGAGFAMMNTKNAPLTSTFANTTGMGGGAFLASTTPSPTGPSPPSRHTPQLREFIAAARVKAIARHYPLNEILMRQSWLLQDTPAHTIRALVTQLSPRSFHPGEVILCPHSTARQLCFLRRGTMTIEEPPETEAPGVFTNLASSMTTGGAVCRCALARSCRVLEEVPVGASFGELSVLFGEPRHFVLRAETVCDVWCLSHHGFAETVRRDDALRESLLSKAAALRMRWLGEQRFTTTLARQLRESCELFRDAADSFIRLVQERLEPHVYPPGTLLTSTSSRCEDMFIILHGRVSSIVDGVAEYGPGSVLGEPVIILHRWPIAAVSKSMVEGWKLRRSDLIDALQRMEMLRLHSGEVGGHAPQIMQFIFRSPVPLCEVDAVGRSRMPTVSPPPRGSTYMEYAQLLAEMQLRAICFRFRDFVSWNDISYSTLPGKRLQHRSVVDASRRASAAPNNEGTSPHIATSIQSKAQDVSPWQQNSSSGNGGSAAAPSGTGGGSRLATGSGANAVRRQGEHAKSNIFNSKRKNKRKPTFEKTRRTRLSTGCTVSFHVNSAIAHQPFTRPHLRRPLSAQKEPDDPILIRQRAIKSVGESRHALAVTQLPQLEQCMSLLDARDKLRRAETKQNKLNDTQREQQERIELLDINRNESQMGPAPVHVFLPRVQITVEEAIAVGYILQFPDAKRIQSCVSAIDSDVTIGLPQHRQRRHNMAFTPNDRHHRHCFLFAASQLTERSVGEAMVREIAAQEADSKEKAQHLTAVLVAQLADKQQQQQQEEQKQRSVPNALEPILDTPLDVPSDWQTRSPLPSPAVLSSPAKARSLSRAVAAAASGEAEGAFVQLLQENPERALGNLRARFQIHDAVRGEASDILASARGAVSDISAARPELMDRLRQAVATDQTPTPNTQPALSPSQLPPPVAPRRPSPIVDAGVEENGFPASVNGGEEGGGEAAATTAAAAEPTPLEVLAQSESLPLFIDGYGPLGARSRPPLGPVPDAQGNFLNVMADVANLRDDANGWSGTNAASRESVTSTNANVSLLVPPLSLPQRFVMPDVNEATATMRHIQRDVEGLNAVAEEQRREKMLGRRRPNTAGAVELSLPPSECHRLVEEWAAAYHERIRDPFAPARIPSPLLPDGGTDFLAQEYVNTRQYQMNMDYGTQGVEAWRGEVDTRERKTREEGKAGGGAKAVCSVMAPVGAQKLGRRSQPLRNPTAGMSPEAYKRWMEESDAIFADVRTPSTSV